MFDAKLADARAATDKIFGTNKPDCACARASAVDVVYDKSPAIAELELTTWAVPMLANFYYKGDPNILDEDASDWLYAYSWCMFNINRCSNDRY